MLSLLLALIHPNACLAAADNCSSSPSHEAYQFESGEALAYRMDLSVTNHQVSHAALANYSGHSEQNKSTEFNIDLQLMPIARDAKDNWKLRLVLDQIQRMTKADGDVQSAKFDRRILQMPQLKATKMFKLDWRNYVPQATSNEVGTASNGPGTLTARPTEDLFDDPITLWLTPHGHLEKLEYRTELASVVPGLDLKACLELALPELPGEEIKEGAEWSRDIPVDLPEKPLSDAIADPTSMRLCYRATDVKLFQGRPCRRIELAGHFKRDGLSIPIRKEQIKYLMWTVAIVALEDHLEGEFLYDAEKGRICVAEVRTTYSYRTEATRKEDGGRGKLKTENISRTTLVSRLLPAQPAIARHEH